METLIANKTYDEIVIGESASLVKTLRKDDIELFALVSGDLNPTHLDDEYASNSPLKKVVGHSMWTGSLISGVLGTHLPGPGTVYRRQSFEFHRPVTIGDVITATVTVTGKNDGNTVELDCACTNQEGKLVANGKAEVVAPTEKVSRVLHELPDVKLRIKHHVFDRLIADCQKVEPISAAVCHPCDQVSLVGAVEAALKGLINPVLVGPESKIRSVAEAEGVDISPYRIINVEHSHQSAEKAVALCRTGETEALMKGSLHTDELMHEVANRNTGLRTARRISHVFVMDVPTYSKMLLITDAAINIYPSLEDKVDICQNAIDLAHVLGVDEPKVAILSAVETVYPKIASTLEAAALCKMADRGQIKGGILDGPLAFDNAISVEAARIKKINSVVAGHADILLTPDLEAGNMLAKQLSYLAEADAAGVVLGARVPIILTSRADTPAARLASCAVAVRFALSRRTGQQKLAAE